MTAIICENVGINFVRMKAASQSRKFFGYERLLLREEKFWALRNLSFSVPEGKVLGIIGNNGAGKSTLLKVLTGILSPDEGKVNINGNVSALLALGAGFLADLSGRDNIFLSAAYLGMSEIDIKTKFEEIVDFSELRDFIDTPIRYYSSGMKARLGFSLAVHVEPDILIIDEVLATGDRSFQRKAEQKMKAMMMEARAIIIVSHNTRFIKEMCDDVIWLEQGCIRDIGSSEEIVSRYEQC